MSEFPGWMREQLQVEGWVVVESIETFDVHLGQRYPNRAQALQKALVGDALLSSQGKAATSGDLEQFVIGRLVRRAAHPTAETEVLLLHWLDSIERHTRKTTTRTRPEAAPGARETRAWTCPHCRKTWQLLAEEPDVPEDQARCPDCGEPPSEFAPGQIVRVRSRTGARSRLGIIDEPVRAGCFKLDEPNVVNDVGPYTGEYMVFHLTEGYGSQAAVTPELERAVFANLPREPARRRLLAAHLMTGVSAARDLIHALGPEEATQLSPA